MIYARPSDNIISTATITISSGTEVTGYEKANLYNQAWDIPFWIAETTLDLRFDFGAAVALKWVTLGNSNVDVAAKWQGHTADSWGTPDIDQTFAVPSQNARGIFSSPHLDLSATASKRYWRLSITGNTDAIAIGELGIFTARRSTASGYRYNDSEFGASGATALHETGFGVEMAYELHASREDIVGDIAVTAAELADMQSLMDDARYNAKPFWMLPYEGYADAWFVRFAGQPAERPRLMKRPWGPSKWYVDLPVRMQSRGAPWSES